MAKKFPADEIVGQMYWEEYYSDKNQWEIPQPHELWDAVLSKLETARAAAEHCERTGGSAAWLF
jgi:hypothetical protein